LSSVYAVGVGPGAPDFISKKVEEIILEANVIVGYKYTLETIKDLLKDKEVFEITMQTQEEVYQNIKKKLGEKTLVVPFTGDVNFSESEVVDRLIEIFGEIQIVPGISSIQVAASKAMVPLDKSRVLTLHISTSIEREKIELQKALLDGFSVILVPRPWPKDPKKHFMPSDIAIYLKKNGFDTSKIKIHVFENLTKKNEMCFIGKLNEAEGKEFSDLTVMVFNQYKLNSYISF
jgi:precorrin-6y C5,15-methyltransferase (decarboxylating) CbiE subunit